MVHSVRYSACISFITCNIFETTSREMSSQNTNQPRRSLRLSGYQTHVCVLNSCDYLLMQKHLFSIQQFLEEYLAFLVQVCKWSFRLVAPKSQMYNTSSLSFFFYVCHHLCEGNTLALTDFHALILSFDTCVFLSKIWSILDDESPWVWRKCYTTAADYDTQTTH